MNICFYIQIFNYFSFKKKEMWRWDLIKDFLLKFYILKIISKEKLKKSL